MYVKIHYNMYEGSQPPWNKYLLDDETGEYLNGTKEECEELINEVEESVYYLHNGEAGRPDYEIVEELED